MPPKLARVAQMQPDVGRARLRLTFRYRARAWTVVVKHDGTLIEIAKVKAKTETTEAQ